MGRWVDGSMGRWGDGLVGRWGDRYIPPSYHPATTYHPSTYLLMSAFVTVVDPTLCSFR